MVKFTSKLPKWGTRAIALMAALPFFLLAEGSVAYNLGSIFSTPDSRTVVYGNWDQTQYVLEVPVSNPTDPISDVSWSVSGVPDGASSTFSGTDVSSGFARTTLFIDQVANTSGPDVGTYQLKVTSTSSNGPREKDLVLRVNPRPVKITGVFEVSTKTYDGSTDSEIASSSLFLELYSESGNPDRGLLSRDDAVLVPVSTLGSKNVGLQNANLLSSSLSGADGENYLLDFGEAPTSQAQINPKPLKVSGLTFTKVYDGLLDISATGTPTISEGLVDGDPAPIISGSPTWILGNPNTGTGKQVSVGANAYSSSNSNYFVDATTLFSAVVTARPLTANFTITSRPYNGSADVTPQVTISGLSGLVASDSSVSASFSSATADSKDFGTHRVTISGLTLDSEQARQNYSLESSEDLFVVIAKRALTLGGTLTASARPYNATLTATGDTSNLQLVGVVGFDQVLINSVDLNFAQANQGTNIPVFVSSFSLSGVDSGNYTTNISGAPTTVASITPFELTVSATVVPKIYDGTRVATVNCSANTFADGLGVSANCESAEFTGDGSVVLAGGLPQPQSVVIQSVTLLNNALGNYAISGTQVASQGTITPKSLTVSGLSGVDREYDGTTFAQVSGTPVLSGKVGLDEVNLDLSEAQFVFSNKRAGPDKQITASGITLTGDRAANYVLTSISGLSANIEARPLEVSVSHPGKTFDATRDVNRSDITLTLSGVLPGDTVEPEFSEASFNSASAGTRTVTVEQISLTGVDSENYVVDSTAANENIEIYKRSLTILEPRMTFNSSQNGTATFQRSGTIRVCDENGANCTGDRITLQASGSFGTSYVHSGPFSWEGSITITGLDKDNYSFELPTSPANGQITRRTLSIGGLSASSGKVYDSSTDASSLISGSPSLSGVVEGTPSLVGTGTFTFASKYVGGSIRVSTTGFSLVDADVNGDGVAEYQLTQPFWDRAITPRTLTIGGSFEANNKIYDRGTAASLETNLLTLVDVQGSDSVTLTSPIINFTSSAANELVPTSVSIASASLSSSGDMNGDGVAEYSLSLEGAPTTSATISRRSLDSTLSLTVSNKVYDGTTTAIISSGPTVTPLSGDIVSVAPGSIATFQTRTFGTNKPVDINNLSITGDQASNYSLESSRIAFRTANITRKPLTISGITSPGKIYDRTTTAPKRLDGAPACLKDEGDTCVVDDLAAQLVGVVAPGGVIDDVVLSKLSGSFVFNNSGQGNRTLSGSGYSITGSDATNYQLNQPSLSNINIGRKTVSVSASGGTRVYNGTNNASSIVELVISGVIGPDVVTVAASAITFDGALGRNVGENKAITASGLTISGAQSGNYSLNGQSSAVTQGTITPFGLTLSATGQDKVYDGTDSAVVTCSVNRFIVLGVADDVSADCSAATFATKNVSRLSYPSGTVTSQVISVANVTISGLDSQNYSLVSDTASTSGIISPKPLLARGFAPLDKEYDGNRGATFNIETAILEGFVDGDSFIFSAIGGLFASADVSRVAGVPVSQNVRLNSWTFSGASDEVTSNYTIDIDNSTTQAKINPKPLAVSVIGPTRVYNGNSSASLTVSFPSSSLVLADRTPSSNVTASASGAFVDKNVGSGKIINISSSALAGPRSPNYVIQAPETTTGTITQRSLIWSISAENKVYDGTDLATVTIADNRISGDVFSVSYSSARFTSPSVGIAKNISIEGISIEGVDAGNYSYLSLRQTTANITLRQIFVSGTFSVDSKVYDTTSDAQLGDTSGLFLANVAEADIGVLEISAIEASFDSSSIGTSKTVTINSISLGGAVAPNYSVNLANLSPYTQGEITPYVLTPSIAILDRLYDSTTDATIVSILVAPLAGDSVEVDMANVVAQFLTPEQGEGKEVLVSGLALGGTSAVNYFISPSAIAFASITGKPLEVTVSGIDKTYDGTVTAQVLADSILGLDPEATDVSVEYSSAVFVQSSAGNDITVLVSGMRLVGDDSGYYFLTSTATSTSASIFEREVRVLGSGKVYDGNRMATVTLDGVISGDDVVLNYSSANFVDKNVGTNKPVSLSNPFLSGADSVNYVLSADNSIESEITPRRLDVEFVSATPISGPLLSVRVVSSDNRIEGDDLGIGYDRAEVIQVGNQVSLRVSGIRATGTDAANYFVSPVFSAVLFELEPSSESTNQSQSSTGETPGFVTAPNQAAPSRPGVLPVPAPSERPGPDSGGVTRTVTPVLPSLGSLFAPPGSSGATSQGAMSIDIGNGVRPLGEVASSESELIRAVTLVGTRTVSELAADRIVGFAPASSVSVEVLGARTGARFILSGLNESNPDSVSRSIRSSAPQLSTEFFEIWQVTPGEAPTIKVPWSLEDIQRINAFFAAAGLSSPSNLNDAEFAEASNWITVQAQAQSFVPGSTVYLVITSNPLVIGSAEVDDFGRARIEGSIPIDALGFGEHSLRVVGVRSLEGATVDDKGELQLSEDLLTEISRFDAGTISTIVLSGVSVSNGLHTAVRVVSLGAQAPWWTLWFIFASLLFAGLYRVFGSQKSFGWKVLHSVSVMLAALPAIISGWISMVFDLTIVGLVMGITFALLLWLVPGSIQSKSSAGSLAMRRKP